jgi:hypothetical protein
MSSPQAPNPIKTLRESIRKKMDELDSFKIELPKGANLMSPTKVFMAIGEARAYSDNIAQVYCKAIEVHNACVRQVRAAERTLDVAMVNKARSKPPDIEGVKGFEERDRILRALLPAEVEALDIAKSLEEEASAFVTAVKIRHQNMRDTRDDILTQLGAIRTGILMGELKVVDDVAHIAKMLDDSRPVRHSQSAPPEGAAAAVASPVARQRPQPVPTADGTVTL